MPLRERDIERYARQIIIPEIGVEGQMRLLDTHVRILGRGCAAKTALLYLRAAGVDAVAESPADTMARTPAGTDRRGDPAAGQGCVIDLSCLDTDAAGAAANARAAAAGCEAACAFIARTLDFDDTRPSGSLEDALA